jgi:hypothetical protein
LAAKEMTTGPSIKRFRSKQSIATPWEFIHAVERKFGPLRVDLAATVDNFKAPSFISPERDTFQQDWNQWRNGWNYAPDSDVLEQNFWY